MGQLHMLLQLFSILLAFIIALKMFSFPPDEQPRNFTTMKQIKKKTKVTHVPMTHDILLLVFSLWFLPILIDLILEKYIETDLLDPRDCVCVCVCVFKAQFPSPKVI